MFKFDQRIKELLCEEFQGKGKQIVAFFSTTKPTVALIYSVNNVEVARGLFKIEGNKLVPPITAYVQKTPTDMHGEIRIKAFLTQLAMGLDLNLIKGHGPKNPKIIYSLTAQ